MHARHRQKPEQPCVPSTHCASPILGTPSLGWTTALALHAPSSNMPAQRMSGCAQVLMVATDVYRPAAIDQLVSLGSRIDVPVFELGTSVSPPEIARKGLDAAKQVGVLCGSSPCAVIGLALPCRLSLCTVKPCMECRREDQKQLQCTLCCWNQQATSKAIISSVKEIQFGTLPEILHCCKGARGWRQIGLQCPAMVMVNGRSIFKEY